MTHPIADELAEALSYAKGDLCGLLTLFGNRMEPEARQVIEGTIADADTALTRYRQTPPTQPGELVAGLRQVQEALQTCREERAAEYSGYAMLQVFDECKVEAALALLPSLIATAEALETANKKETNP